MYLSAPSGLSWWYFKIIHQRVKRKVIIIKKSWMTLLSCQLYFPFQYQGINYPWRSYLRKASVYHIIIVVTGPKFTNGNPTWDIWQRPSEMRCLSHWLILSHYQSCVVLLRFNQRGITDWKTAPVMAKQSWLISETITLVYDGKKPL